MPFGGDVAASWQRFIQQQMQMQPDLLGPFRGMREEEFARTYPDEYAAWVWNQRRAQEAASYQANMQPKRTSAKARKSPSPTGGFPQTAPPSRPRPRTASGEEIVYPDARVIDQQKRDFANALLSIWESVVVPEGGVLGPPRGGPDRVERGGDLPSVAMGYGTPGSAGRQFPDRVMGGPGPFVGLGYGTSAPYIPTSDQVQATNYVQARGFQPGGFQPAARLSEQGQAQAYVNARGFGPRLGGQPSSPLARGAEIARSTPGPAPSSGVRTFDPNDPSIIEASRRFEEDQRRAAEASVPPVERGSTWDRPQMQYDPREQPPPPQMNYGPPPEGTPPNDLRFAPGWFQYSPPPGYSDDGAPIDYGAGLSPYEPEVKVTPVRPAPYGQPPIPGPGDVNRWYPQNTSPPQWGSSWPQLGW